MQKLTYETYGTGSNHILLLHAFPLDGRMWAAQTEVLKEKYTVLVPDMRCFGKNKQNETVFCTIDTYADDVLQIINEEKLETVTLCGLSIGGYIILRCLQKFPERISKVILANTRAENDDNAGLLNRAGILAQLQEGKKDEVMNVLLEKLLCKQTLETKPELMKHVKEIMQQQTIDAMQSATVALAMRINSVSYLRDINIPALIIVGEDDVLTPPAFSQTMHVHITDSHLQVIKNAGHLSNMEQPAEFNKALSRFLAD